MSYFEAVILGLIQGLAEFLPISSSGHLALMQQWFGIEEDKSPLFAVLLHVGTLVSVFIVYWERCVGTYQGAWSHHQRYIYRQRPEDTGKAYEKTGSYDNRCHHTDRDHRHIVQ